MKIDIVKVGELECNCYILDINGCVLVIDPGDEYDMIIDKIGDRRVIEIIVTHYHFDHIGALNEIVNKYDVIVYDKNNLIEGENEIGEFSFDVLYTPGHKEDCMTIYFKKDRIMFCGDFIFRNSVGRCDLPGGNIGDMIKSINKIKEYDDDIVIYPGHGDSTTIGYEKNNNIYFLDVNFI